jgi:hypothetical protein
VSALQTFARIVTVDRLDCDRVNFDCSKKGTREILPCIVEKHLKSVDGRGKRGHMESGLLTVLPLTSEHLIVVRKRPRSIPEP